MTPDEIREFFAKDRFAAATGIEILEVSEGYAKTRLVVEDRHLNANNVVMGGCVYTLADFTFALAANCGELRSMTLSSNIVFNSPANGKILYAETEIITNGRKVCNFLVRITDEKERTVATVNVIGFRS
ncbi:MAG TPA: phenylacetic acid degradation protein [Clostridiales bacterium]|nr:phenylacetic acid degradation protein [Clostridiales bacterium]